MLKSHRTAGPYDTLLFTFSVGTYKQHQLKKAAPPSPNSNINNHQPTYSTPTHQPTYLIHGLPTRARQHVQFGRHCLSQHTSTATPTRYDNADTFLRQTQVCRGYYAGAQFYSSGRSSRPPSQGKRRRRIKGSADQRLRLSKLSR